MGWETMPNFARMLHTLGRCQAVQIRLKEMTQISAVAYCVGSFYVNSTQAGVIGEEGASTEKKKKSFYMLQV